MTLDVAIIFIGSNGLCFPDEPQVSSSTSSSSASLYTTVHAQNLRYIPVSSRPRTPLRGVYYRSVRPHPPSVARPVSTAFHRQPVQYSLTPRGPGGCLPPLSPPSVKVPPPTFPVRIHEDNGQRTLVGVMPQYELETTSPAGTPPRPNSVFRLNRRRHSTSRTEC